MFSCFLTKGKKAFTYPLANNMGDKIIVATNNRLASFYLNLEDKTNTNWEVKYYDERKNRTIFEKYALDNKARIIIFKIKDKKLEKLPKFKFYEFVTAFSSNEYTTNIYER